jgi:hypothetical protein
MLTLLLAALILCPVVSAQENEEAEENGLHTGPIDPAAGAWVQYRGERSVPDQPGPQPFYLRITYDYPAGTPNGAVLQAEVEELAPTLQPTSSLTYLLYTGDRLYEDPDGENLGYWPYWLTPRLSEGDTATIEADTNLQGEEEKEYEFQDKEYKTLIMRGEGIELEVERRTGLVFRLSIEDAENLVIDDTNMMAQYYLWGYYPDNTEVGERLEGLANSFPDLVEFSSIGESMKGRNIWMAHITDFTSIEAKHPVLFTAALDGNAPQGSDFLLDFVDQLVERVQEEESLAELFKEMDIYVVPLLNPDGLERWLAMPDPSESEKLSNQAPLNGNLVRLNRNFAVKWAEGGREPATADYAGSEPFSESESQALRNLLEDIAVSMYINLQNGVNHIITPWNWNSSPASNPEKSLYESILSELSLIFPYSLRVGVPLPFTGSATDWAYEGNGASSPLCFNLYMEEVGMGEDADDEESDITELEERGSLTVYEPFTEASYYLIEHLQSFLAVEINTSNYSAEVNVPLDIEVEIVVSGRRSLPDAEARLVLTNGSGVKLATKSEKEVELGNLLPGSSTTVTWEIEGKASGTYIAEVVITSSYPEYENIPGNFAEQIEIVISTQRTWLVLVLLSMLVLFILTLVFLSMRKHQKKESGS